jgi:hypothetical protein
VSPVRYEYHLHIRSTAIPVTEEWCLLGCYAVWLLYEPAFRRNLGPPSSG